MMLPAGYTEELRYFHPSRHAMMAVTREGVVLTREAFDDDGRIFARKKDGVAYDDRIAVKRTAIARLPAWAAEIKEIPSPEEIERWLFDGVCPTPTGDEVEPDGQGPDGAPSWLVALGLI